jgi:hypothetical protein
MLHEVIRIITDHGLNSELLLRACNLLPEPERTDKLLSLLSNGILNCHYNLARGVTGLLTRGEYTPRIEEHIMVHCLEGNRSAAEATATLLSRCLTVSENFKLIEVQAANKDLNALVNSVQVFLSMVEKEAVQKSKKGTTSTDSSTN